MLKAKRDNVGNVIELKKKKGWEGEKWNEKIKKVVCAS